MDRMAVEENIPFQTASDVAYEKILQKIIDGDYPPGMKLSRRKMADATGVSVIPVIEALKKLEANYLVESKPQWGSFVTVPTRDRVIKTFEIREALECQVARIMCKKITKAQTRFMMDVATELDTVPYIKENIMDSRKKHLEFHLSLAKFTENEMIADSLKKINLFWILCNALNAKASKTEYPRYWHRKLVETIIAGDEDAAEKAMREHVRDSLDPILANFKE